MMIDDDTFFAWLDGELDPAQAAEVEAAVAADPVLGRKAEQHRAFAARVRTAFDTVAEQPVPASLRNALQPRAARVIDFASWRERLRSPGLFCPVPQWAAMAASLVLGIGLGTMTGGGSAGPVELRGGEMVAAAALDRALDTQLASAGGGPTVRVGLTFRDRSGAICRSFVDATSSGLACREGEDWRVRGLFAAPEGQGGDYRMAAGADPGLAALIDSTIEGEALNADQERSARAKGWR